jgi:hypothetical protein
MRNEKKNQVDLVGRRASQVWSAVVLPEKKKKEDEKKRSCGGNPNPKKI